MINCYEFQDRISSYIDKEIPLSQVTDFEQHAQQCNDCKMLLNEVASNVQTLQKLPKYSVSPGFMQKLEGKLEKMQQQQRMVNRVRSSSSSFFNFTPRYVLASVAVVGMVIILLIAFVPIQKDATMNTNPSLPTFAPATSYKNPPSIQMPAAQVTNVDESASESTDSTTASEKKSQKRPNQYKDKIKLVKNE